MPHELSTGILKAVDSRFDEQIAFTSELSGYPSTRGGEEGALFVADWCGLESLA